MGITNYELRITNLSLIIPAYNEATRLPAFLDSIAAYTRQQPTGIHEIIIVDDGSTDATAQIAKDFGAKLPQLKVISYQQNRGKGYAVKTGVMAATGDLIIFMDADGATPISQLPNMVAALQEGEIAVGNRWMVGATVERHSLIRQFAGWVYRQYMALFGLGAIDTMCGFKGYRAAVAQDLFNNLIENRWLFDTEIAYKAIRHGYSVKNFPIEWEAKAGSNLTPAQQIKIAFQIWPLIQKIKQQERHA